MKTKQTPARLRTWMATTLLLGLLLASCETNSNNKLVKVQVTIRNQQVPITFSVPIRLYEGLRERAGYLDYNHYLINDPYLPGTKLLAEQLNQQIEPYHLNRKELRSVILQVAQARGYKMDSVDPYLTHFPLVTLVDSGQCSNLSILAIALLRAYDFKCCFIRLPGHCAVGIECEPGEPMYAYCNGHAYALAETTDRGWEVGEVPPNLKHVPSQTVIEAEGNVYFPRSSYYELNLPEVVVSAKRSKTPQSLHSSSLPRAARGSRRLLPPNPPVPVTPPIREWVPSE